MEHAYSTLMFIFAAVLFLYALMVFSGQTGLIPKYWAAAVDDEKRYARRMGKILMLVSTAPLLSGIVGWLFPELLWMAFLTLLFGFIAAVVLGIKKIKP